MTCEAKLTGNHTLIAKTFACLQGEKEKTSPEPEHTPPFSFIEKLLEYGLAEDLALYTPQSLADIALEAWGWLKLPANPATRIRITSRSICHPRNPEHSRLITAITLINEDSPFLLDSVMNEINARKLEIHLVLHPIITLSEPGQGGTSQKSLIIIHLDLLLSEEEQHSLVQSINTILDTVLAVAADRAAMIGRLEKAIRGLETNASASPLILPEEQEEAIHFLKWLSKENFVLVGMCDYIFADPYNPTSSPDIHTPAGEGLGLLRNPQKHVFRQGSKMAAFPPELPEFIAGSSPLIITKTNVRSLVHRRVHLDYVGIKIFSDAGKAFGELRIIGLFTAATYTGSVFSVPYLRRKVSDVLRQIEFDPAGHSGRVVNHIIETYPRDELFQIDTEMLAGFVLTIMLLAEHPRLRILPRIDKFNRFVSILVFIPRDRFSTQVAALIGDCLARSYEGRVSALYPAFLEGALIRVHYIIGHDNGVIPCCDPDALEAELVEITRNWSEKFSKILLDSPIDPDVSARLQARYKDAFSPAYQNHFSVKEALGDMAFVERLASGSVNFICNLLPCPDKNEIHFKLFSWGRIIALSDGIPILENMGFRIINEDTYPIQPRSDQISYLHLMRLAPHDNIVFSYQDFTSRLFSVAQHIENCFTAVSLGYAEDDRYNGLVLGAGLTWRQIAVIRAYSRYLRQIPLPYEQHDLQYALNKHSSITADLVLLFETRFDPDLPLSSEERAERMSQINARIEAALSHVKVLSEDRIIRLFMRLIMATLRCSVFQRIQTTELSASIPYEADEKGFFPSCMAFKIDPQQLENLPRPRPYAEIWVYSTRVEGIHLRFGKVARGGLRWSDRPQDFRTEVLGLVKAQQVKNALIVPVGAKGGFVPKKIPPNGTREQIQEEGQAAYKIFISGLLDLTDSIKEGETLLPPGLIAYDAPDPYLVVAADKGTASFSDLANSIAQEKQFWLHDAFASGGAVGYDHKKMGITAKGAWEAVKRHFREMGRNTQTEAFTVLGVGDMSGDVFGNGMLLSEKICLVAAFDHRDIFIDPTPDPAKSYAERQRLFNLPRSSWGDYNPALLSEGGGVFSRQAKFIPLSPQIRQMTGLDTPSATPSELITALLKTHVDLLWFGGIGTYVRATSETNETIGDRANDEIRVTAKELSAKVIGEGANLAMTQFARIEFALNGGRLNTDAIDNSAGVNSSDLEVNIKICLEPDIHCGLLTREKRNRLLEEMTPHVAELVLRNNYLQTFSISLAQERGMSDLPFQNQLIQMLEQRQLLDRRLENLPGNSELMQREKENIPLTRPELAILLAYAKIFIFNALMDSSILEDPYLVKELIHYFPEQMRLQHQKSIENHKLRREIIATMLANSMITHGGISLIPRMMERGNINMARLTLAFITMRDVFRIGSLYETIDALDHLIPNALQTQLYLHVQNCFLGQVEALLRRSLSHTGIIFDCVHLYSSGMNNLLSSLQHTPPESQKDRRLFKQFNQSYQDWIAKGISQEIATRLAALDIMILTPSIIHTAQKTGSDISEVADVFIETGNALKIDWLKEKVGSLHASDHDGRCAISHLQHLFSDAQEQISAYILMKRHGGDPTYCLDHLIAASGSQLTEELHLLTEFESRGGSIRFEKLFLLSSSLQTLIPDPRLTES